MIKYGRFLLCIVIGVSMMLGADTVLCAAPAVQDAAGSGGGYLAAYQDTAAPKPAQTSWWSTFAYMLSLLVVFAFVAVLAYFASKFLGNRVSAMQAGKSSKVLESLPLGTNRSLCVVEVAGKVLLIGVTEQNITLLNEITDAAEIIRLRNAATEELGHDDFQRIFEKQLSSLNQLSSKIPTLLKERRDRK